MYGYKISKKRAQVSDLLSWTFVNALNKNLMTWQSPTSTIHEHPMPGAGNKGEKHVLGHQRCRLLLKGAVSADKQDLNLANEKIHLLPVHLF